MQHLWLQEVNYYYLLCWLWSVQALTSSVSMVHESRAHECDQTQNWTVDWVLAPTHQGPNLSFETIHRLPKKKPESHRGFKRIFGKDNRLRRKQQSFINICFIYSHIPKCKKFLIHIIVVPVSQSEQRL